MAVVRVLSYNVRGLRDDTAALARVIRQAEPDIVLVQEAPIYLRWRSKCAKLARECGLVYVKGGRSAGGNLLMVAPRVRTHECVELRIRQPLRDPIRGVVSGTVEMAGARLGVVGCHLGLRADGRVQQVGEVIAAANAIGKPTIIAGDLNEPPTGKSWQALKQAGFHAPKEGDNTFPASQPRIRIDAILASDGIEVLEYGIAKADEADLTRATDHLPLLAVLDIAAE